MDLKHADRELRQALKRLTASDTRLKRRNARLALFGLLRQIKNTVNDVYPAIAKPKPPPEPRPEKPAKVKPAKPPRIRLPFRKPYSFAAVDLFGRLVYSYYQLDGINPPLKSEWLDMVLTLGRFVSDRLHAGSRVIGISEAQLEIVELYRQFWQGEIFVSDLELAAEHQQFIERRKK